MAVPYVVRVKRMINPDRWQQIERLFHAALERNAEERAAFVSARCGADDELRREVESLLGCQAESGNFMAEPAGGRLREPINDALTRQIAFLPGRCVGRRLGAYEVKAWVATGGMGEVYRAVDTRLHRTVAIKVLIEHLSDHPEWRDRLKREASVISGLNHPHICTLYDIGEQDGIDYLVMEYIEGETLQARLSRRGPLPLPRAIEYLIQVADALDKAHRCGIIHRDLKPGNVMLTPSGVKLLDFGIATRLTAREAHHDPSGQPAGELHRSSTALGTPGYSSPEQLQGKALDARSDVFSFGLTAYEMLTGRGAFTSASDEEPVPLRVARSDVPPALETTVLRCLAKEPDERWQTANDLLFHLRSLKPAEPVELRSGARRISRWTERAVWMGALVSFSLAALYWTWNTRNERMPSMRSADVRFSVRAPEGTQMYSVRDIPFAVSPDGRSLVFAAVDGAGIRHLWLRRLSVDSERPELLHGTHGANTPFWSPDSEWVGFFSSDGLKKIRLSGMVVQSIAPDVSSMAGAAWSREDVIVFPASPRGLARVSAQGGAVLQLTSGDGSHFWPQFLADGKHLLYAAAAAREVRITSVAKDTSRILMKFPVRVSSFAYSYAYLFFVQDGTLFARPFNEQRLELEGAPAPVLRGVPVTPPGRAPFSVSAAGPLVWWPYANGTPAVLRWYSRDGQSTTAIHTPAKYVGFSLSPDGHSLALSRREETGNADIWLRDLSGGSETQLTFDGAAFAPRFSPDGSRIAFSGPGGAPPPRLFVRRLSETGHGMEVGIATVPRFPSCWSSDGRAIVSVRIDTENRNDLWLEGIGEGTAQRLSISSRAGETSARLSPGDQWIAYVTDSSGRNEVWVASFPDGEVRRRVSDGGGTAPNWAPDGRELYYWDDQGRLMAVGVKFGPKDLVIGRRRALFQVGNVAEMDSLLVPTSNSYTVAPDGRRFLVAVRAPNPNTPPLRVLANWRALVVR